MKSPKKKSEIILILVNYRAKHSPYNLLKSRGKNIKTHENIKEEKRNKNKNERKQYMKT
jgi:hypothetical protein